MMEVTGLSMVRAAASIVAIKIHIDRAH
jgi:hypothetical protein